MDCYKLYRKTPYLVFAAISLTLGLTFLLSNEISVEHMCLIWGIYDICKAIFGIVDATIEVKDNKLEIMEIVASIGHLVFGVLLCVHLSEGITAHLIFMGVAFLIVALKFGIEFIMNLQQELKKEYQLDAKDDKTKETIKIPSFYRASIKLRISLIEFIVE